MPISPARYLAFLFGGAATILAGAALLVWRVDPLQHYRAAPGRDYYGDQPRWQNPGLARHADYDLALAGTSVSLGFDLGDTARILGARPLNLAMQGASAREQRRLLEVALRSGRVRRVVWELNYEFFRGDPAWVSDLDGAFPAFLYDESPWNDAGGYLLNADLLRTSARLLAGRYPRRTLAEVNVHRPARPAGQASVEAAFERARREGTVFSREGAAFGDGRPMRSFEENVLPLLRAHPEVQWDLHFPPFHLTYYRLMLAENSSAIFVMFHWRDGIADALADLPHVRLHDFQGTVDIITDDARYFDTVHFDRATHNWVLERIADGARLGTLDRRAETMLYLLGNVLER